MTRVAVSARVTPQPKKRLRALAKTMRRSESSLAGDAIEVFLATEEWQVALIKERLAAAKKGGPTVPHAEVEVWVRSWGSKQELPRPKARR